MKTAKVIYANGNVITTSINGTDDEIREYFAIGRKFNIGNGEQDDLQSVIGLVIN